MFNGTPVRRRYSRSVSQGNGEIMNSILINMELLAAGFELKYASAKIHINIISGTWRRGLFFLFIVFFYILFTIIGNVSSLFPIHSVYVYV